MVRRCGDMAGGLVHIHVLQIGNGVVQVHLRILPEGLQIGDHSFGGLIALFNVRSHGLETDQLQLRRDIRVDLPRRQRNRAQMLNSHRDRRIPLKGQPTGEHLIEHHAGRVDIGPGVSTVAPSLLRRDIVDGAQCLLGQGLGRVLQTRDAEVGHLHTAVPQHHDVLGLDVPVDDAPAVGVAQALHDLSDEVERLSPVQLAPPLHILLERDAVDQLHDDVFRLTALGHVIDRDDIGMRQHGNRLGFGVKTAAEVRILGQVALQDLHRHQTVEAMTLGLVDHGHTAGSDALENLVAVIQHFSDIRIHVASSLLSCSASGQRSRCLPHRGSWRSPSNGPDRCPAHRRG